MWLTGAVCKCFYDIWSLATEAVNFASILCQGRTQFLKCCYFWVLVYAIITGMILRSVFSAIVANMMLFQSSKLTCASRRLCRMEVRRN